MNPSTPPDPPIQAVALRYDADSAGAPEVVAQGMGAVAEQILAVAEDCGIPICADADLVTLLAACDLGDEIPTELYSTVAELLTWLYRVNEGLKG